MSKHAKTGRSKWIAKLPLLVIICGAVIGALFLQDVLRIETLTAQHDYIVTKREEAYWSLAGLYCLAYIIWVVFSLPGAAILTIIGGAIFGMPSGFILTLVAATTGALAVFLAARWGAGEQLSKRIDRSSGAFSRIKRGLDQNQWSMLFIIRLVPIVPFFVANLIPALLNVPVRRFVISTFLGIVPGTWVYTSLGTGLGLTIEADKAPDLGIIFSRPILFPLLGLAALAAMPVIFKLLSSKRGAI